MLKRTKRKILTSVIVCAAVLFTAVTLSGRTASALTAGDLKNPAKWNVLPGFDYATPNTMFTDGLLRPAKLTFHPVPLLEGNTGNRGITYNGTGYFNVNSTNAAGVIFKDKVDVSNFSIVLTINKLGVDPFAKDDGWIGIGLMRDEKIWNTQDRLYNSGAVALFRPQSSNEAICFNDYKQETGQEKR